jgi:hypothetical protein
MASVELLPSRRLLMIDDRGDALRATWHPDRCSIVLSQWRDDTCRATHELDVMEVNRLVQFLVGMLAAAATPSEDSDPEPRPRSQIAQLIDRIETHPWWPKRRA